METFKALEFLERKYFFNKEDYFDSGSKGKIYRITNDKAAKILYGINGKLCIDRDSQFELFQEYKKQKLAVEFGLKFPKVEGIFAIKENKSRQYYPGLVMEYLDGMNLMHLSGNVLAKALEQRNAELDRARNLGFLFLDPCSKNFLFRENEVYFLDAADVKITV